MIPPFLKYARKEFRKGSDSDDYDPDNHQS